MKRAVLAFAVMFVACLAPTSAQVLPVPVIVTNPAVAVNDPLAEPTWLQTLTQGISTATSLKSVVQTELENLVPTEFRWALNTRNPQAIMVPIFVTGSHELAVYQAQVQTNTGTPPAPDEALEMAQTGMQQIPNDEDDLASAQAASDACTGNLCAQQATHRFDQLSLTNAIEQRQFEYTEYQQKAKGEEAATAWATTPWVP